MGETKYPIMMRRDIFLVVAGILSGYIIHIFFQGYMDRGAADGIIVPMEEFPEPAWRTPATLAVRTVTSTPFARFEIHKVRTESGEIVNDWLWTDERSHVNILVHLKEENKYLLFNQKKYGLDRKYLAVIGGLFNKGETAEECARRELLEETGLEPEQLVNLGAYRVQVNRGGGILHAFLAKNCVKSKKHLKSDDYEKQEAKRMTRNELLEATLRGEVGEAQWVAAVALGLLHEEHNEHHIGANAVTTATRLLEIAPAASVSTKETVTASSNSVTNLRPV